MMRTLIAFLILLAVLCIVVWLTRRKPHPQQHFFFELVEKNLSDENQKKEDSYHDF
jgi:hypothetical protein